MTPFLLKMITVTHFVKDTLENLHNVVLQRSITLANVLENRPSKSTLYGDLGLVSETSNEIETPRFIPCDFGILFLIDQRNL